MKIKKSRQEISGITNMSQLNLTNLFFLKIFSLPIWLVIISISLSFVSKSVSAGTEDIHLYYRYVPYEGPGSTTGTAGQRPKQSTGANETEAKKTSSGGLSSEGKPLCTGNVGQAKISPVQKPEKDTGEFPSGEFPAFCQVDINGDHNITKDELQNFPELLRVFDKVDAGKDGKLEQHEYQNLEMETKREGEIM